MDGENIITINGPNFVTVGLISAVMTVVIGFFIMVVSRWINANSAGG